uniref:Serpentine receptor class gamma n=1 Tax=Steinernema glaseri TaxID=37863 RepID=A0A1I7ZYM4_9BILA
MASLSAFYGAIYILFRRQAQGSFGKAQRNLFVTMTAILISHFIFFGLPAIIPFILYYLGAPRMVMDYLSAFTGFMSTVTGVTNFFIYGWKHHEVRYHLKAILGVKQVTMVEPMTLQSKRTTKTQEASEGHI